MSRATLRGLASLALLLAAGCPSSRSPAPAPAPASAAPPTEEVPAEPREAAGPRLKSPPGALPGRSDAMPVPAKHHVLGTPLAEPFPVGLERAVFAMGCFWGAEKQFWSLPGVYTTAVGYTAGVTPNATYDEVCTGRTGHAEAVLVVYDPRKTTYEALLKVFWEGHDPTCGDRQGNDVGTQYRSGCYTTTDAQAQAALAAREAYQAELTKAGHGAITTEIQPATDFFYAEKYHQQYLAKHPDGYCGHGGTGVSCPVGLLK